MDWFAVSGNTSLMNVGQKRKRSGRGHHRRGNPQICGQGGSRMTAVLIQVRRAKRNTTVRIGKHGWTSAVSRPLMRGVNIFRLHSGRFLGGSSQFYFKFYHNNIQNGLLRRTLLQYIRPVTTLQLKPVHTSTGKNKNEPREGEGHPLNTYHHGFPTSQWTL
jgi:hypothetical protein